MSADTDDPTVTPETARRSSGPAATGAGGYAISPLVRTAADDDGMILLDLGTGRYSAFNQVGALVWSKVEEGLPQHAIIRELRETFADVPAERIEHDVEAILARLEENRLIAPAGAVPQDRWALASDVETRSAEPTSTASLAAGSEASGSEEEEGGERARGGRGDLYWNVVAFLTLVYVDVMMRFFPFRRLYRLLRNCRPSAPRADVATRQRICSAMDRAAAAYFKRAWCLQRSAACVYLLRRRGVPAQLVLGVRTFPFEAHAWAELGGRVLNDTTDYTGRFLVLDRI